jgi:hypothetical protein
MPRRSLALGNKTGTETSVSGSPAAVCVCVCVSVRPPWLARMMHQPPAMLDLLVLSNICSIERVTYSLV